MSLNSLGNSAPFSHTGPLHFYPSSPAGCPYFTVLAWISRKTFVLTLVPRPAYRQAHPAQHPCQVKLKSFFQMLDKAFCVLRVPLCFQKSENSLSVVPRYLNNRKLTCQHPETQGDCWLVFRTHTSFQIHSPPPQSPHRVAS